MAQLETIHGFIVDILNPDPFAIYLPDIAHGLSMQCRFGGHTARHYSVAEHSWWVSKLCAPEYALQGLLHDATEAYLCDIPTPIKRLLPDYYTLEHRLWEVIADKFGVPVEMHESVKEADARMCITEKLDLIGPERLDGPAWIGLTSRFSRYGDVKLPRDPNYMRAGEAQGLFLQRFAELTR